MPNKLYYIRRDGLKKTSLDFSNETGVLVYRIVDIERGNTVPTIEEIEKLSKLYGITGTEMIAHVVDYIGVSCTACSEKYLKNELYVCEKCSKEICEDCSSGDGEEILCPSCAKQGGAS